MKVRNNKLGPDEGIELQMTPMIDIVFQLLVFFIMTFKIVAMEGDFNIKMPLAALSDGLPDEDDIPPMTVKLSADAAGNLGSIRMNDIAYPTFQKLRERIISVIGTERGPNSTHATAEVELDCDFNLKYTHVIEAVTHVSGYVDPSTKQIVKLVEKIKFKPQPPRAG
jgi:biopolymer transport protein ExbD